MFTGPVGPVEVFFYWPEAVLGNIYWPGAIGSPLASGPAIYAVNAATLRRLATRAITHPSSDRSEVDLTPRMTQL